MGIENQKPNNSEIIKPISEGQAIESESQIVGVEKESQELELSLERNGIRRHQSWNKLQPQHQLR